MRKNLGQGHGRWSYIVPVVAALTATLTPATAQKSGGTLRMYQYDSAPSASLHEESTASAAVPFMSIYNNLVLFDQQKAHESLDSIVPELGESWSWDSTRTKLTFKLRHGVKWHDGKPFTARDVQCTWRMLNGKEPREDFRRNPRKIWYFNLDDVTINGDYEATFVLKAPQPSFLILLASGFSPVYPCHVPLRDMRTRPIGTGPFKFVEFKRGTSIKLERNPDYWKKGLPYLDGIDIKIIDNRSTRILAFTTGDFDLTYPADITVPLLADTQKQAPKAVCQLFATGVSANLIVNRSAPPFDNADIRKAMALSLDRNSFNTILSEGKATIGGAMLPLPTGEWGMPQEMVETLTGYGKDVKKNQDEARKIMAKLGYSDVNPLKVKVATRNIASYRDPAVILMDQLKKIYFAPELETVDTPQWYAKVTRKDYQVGLNLTGVSVDDPDGNLVENYTCASDRNYTKYCNAEIDKKIFAQSREADKEKRKKLVWEIERELIDDSARPMIQHGTSGTCHHPYLKNFTMHDNSIYNNWRFEQVWLDK
jgi:peptide/nickel transport system substrate-binding protein